MTIIYRSRGKKVLSVGIYENNATDQNHGRLYQTKQINMSSEVDHGLESLTHIIYEVSLLSMFFFGGGGNIMQV